MVVGTGGLNSPDPSGSRRPARSALTMAAVVLGVASVALAVGLAGSLATYDKAESRADAVQVEVHAQHGPPGGPSFGPPGGVASKLSATPRARTPRPPGPLPLLGQAGHTLAPRRPAIGALLCPHNSSDLPEDGRRAAGCHRLKVRNLRR